MGVLEWIGSTFRSGTMSRHDAAWWGEADSFTFVCGMMAKWLAGELSGRPGYYGKVDVDNADWLRDALIALNLAGFLTDDSQEGWDGPAYKGVWWTQLAAVQGFAQPHTAQWLVEVAEQAGLGWMVHEPANGRGTQDRVPATWREQELMTAYGTWLNRSQVQFTFDEVGEQAVEQICAAYQVTLYDPEPGRNDMWLVLLQAARG